MPEKNSLNPCPKCGAPMEAKGEIEDPNQIQSCFLQCPKCKNIELQRNVFHQWFRLEYP